MCLLSHYAFLLSWAVHLKWASAESMRRVRRLELVLNRTFTTVAAGRVCRPSISPCILQLRPLTSMCAEGLSLLLVQPLQSYYIRYALTEIPGQERAHREISHMVSEDSRVDRIVAKVWTLTTLRAKRCGRGSKSNRIRPFVPHSKCGVQSSSLFMLDRVDLYLC